MKDLAGTKVTILPKPTDKTSTPWEVTVRSIAKDARGVAQGVWTTAGEYFPNNRVQF